MRRGIALAAVLLALALVNALVVGAVFVARRQAAAARIDGIGPALQPLAERGIVQSIAAWDSLARAEQAIAATVVDATNSSAFVTVWITRTSAELYWVVGEARSNTAPLMSRRVGAVVWWSGGPPSVAFPRGWAELP